METKGIDAVYIVWPGDYDQYGLLWIGRDESLAIEKAQQFSAGDYYNTSVDRYVLDAEDGETVAAFKGGVRTR